VKRVTVIVPLLLPLLSDKAAAQLIEVLRALVDAVEHHYAAQIQRYRKRQRDIQLDRSRCASISPLDPPF
jgi:hypothetical protein